MNDIHTHATDFSRDGHAGHLKTLARELHEILDRLKAEPADQLIISEENLLGQMPGKNDVFSYAAAPPLLACVLDVLHDHFGEQAEIKMIFGTRESESWMSSIWKHTLTVKRLQDDEETLKEKLRPDSDLQGVVQELQHFFPDVPISSFSLEDSMSSEFGPATSFLNWMNLPAELGPLIRKTARRNPAGPAEIYAQLLELNRSSLNASEFRAARDAFLEELKVQRKAIMARSLPDVEKNTDD